MNCLAIQSKVTGPVKNPNYKFIYVQLARLIILFPFFSIKNAGLYANSGLWPLFFSIASWTMAVSTEGVSFIQSTVNLSRESVDVRIPRKTYDV